MTEAERREQPSEVIAGTDEVDEKAQIRRDRLRARLNNFHALNFRNEFRE
ncbi:hypothetical protein THTE_1893 [Thermogutta terrifontis]|uniref:Uncharacterized protein n=1 Tax=Thermogutta terrifontis TaxID=1331910 RepID=A0A286REV3_9BACT|nr:hypothetical protein THTE_1893 [Thermogutta terrifontis]